MMLGMLLRPYLRGGSKQCQHPCSREQGLSEMRILTLDLMALSRGVDIPDQVLDGFFRLLREEMVVLREHVEGRLLPGSTLGGKTTTLKQTEGGCHYAANINRVLNLDTSPKKPAQLLPWSRFHYRSMNAILYIVLFPVTHARPPYQQWSSPPPSEERGTRRPGP